MNSDLATESTSSIDIYSKGGTTSTLDLKQRIAAFAVILAIGFFRVWVGRYSISPDGMCYLDLGDAFFHRRWFDAVNGLWSPLYAWLVGAALFIVKPSRVWEFPVAHAVNFLIYGAAFLCFEFLLRSFSEDLRHCPSGSYEAKGWSLSERSLFAIGYALFLWTSLEIITIWAISPDLCVAAFVYLIAGLLLRLRHRGSWQLSVALGVVLGFAYLTKAIMFPVGFAVILLGFCIVTRKKRLPYLLAATFCFLAVCAPWVIALSRIKGRFTFGDAGLINYSSGVSPGGRVINWQGDPPASGIPVHPTRKIRDNPPIYEFASPVGGTYPPSYDPSYWNEGRRWTFNARAQLRVIAGHLVTYAGLLLRDQSGLLAGVLTLILIGGIATRKVLWRNWFLFIFCFAAPGLYLLVHVEVRYVGAYVALLWITTLFCVRLSNSEGQRRLAEYLALAVVVTILLSVEDGTLRAVREGGPFSALDQVAVADNLEKMGLRAGDHIAVLGDGNWSYWARLGKYKIVSTIMASDTPGFWAEKPEERDAICRIFATTGARAVVTTTPPPANAGDGWLQIGASEYYVRWLQQ